MRRFLARWAKAPRLLSRPLSPSGRQEWLDRLHTEWHEVIRPFDPSVPYLFNPAPSLRPRHLQNCRVVPDRIHLLRECLPHGGIVCEVGTFRGEFAESILTLCRPAELHLIDLSFAKLQSAAVLAAARDGGVWLHQMDSTTALRGFPDGYFDWIYIDADHKYEGVKRDIEQAKRKVKPDGLLVFNDYIFWSHAELMPYGVVHAVNELCLTEGWELVWFALQPEMYCDVVLRRLPTHP